MIPSNVDNFMIGSFTYGSRDALTRTPSSNRNCCPNIHDKVLLVSLDSSDNFLIKGVCCFSTRNNTSVPCISLDRSNNNYCISVASCSNTCASGLLSDRFSLSSDDARNIG